ncbi:MAG: methylmalonyl Co-A mutase-associated GTPase MeaB [Gemmatimonadaceae bacterium]|nr:methylmalonyl Co-A mutase-associated GTPase MeaB [Gemmatimonadaceae bacterium]
MTERARLERLLADFAAGRPAALARAISVVEDHRPGFDQLLARLHAQTGRARRIGITGPPGAGKSTLTTALCRALREAGRTVGIVCVDPTSPFSGGALLGDRIRMEQVALDPGVFIRSMATRGSLGGLARATREACDVLDAFGKEVILIETVGVGQSELDVARTADTTLVVLTPESGDSIQTLKAGVMEIADCFVVNKADRPGADRLKHDIELMLGLRGGGAAASLAGHHGVDLSALGDRDALRDAMNPARAARAAARDEEAEDWTPPVLTAVAARSEGITELVAALDRHGRYLDRSGELRRRRRARLKDRVIDATEQKMQDRLWRDAATQAWLDARLDALEVGAVAPFDVADALLAEHASRLATPARAFP